MTLQPPTRLTQAELATWNDVASAQTAASLAGDFPDVLAAYCVAVDTARFIDRQMNELSQRGLKSDLRLKRWLQLAALTIEQTRLIASLATKLDLTQQRRISAKKAYRMARDEVSMPAPWARD
jgi:hypothetical protein